MALESHLRTLLYDNDCVVIPAFGGFLTRYKSAHIHPIQGTVVPPSKMLTFNRKLVANDGLLAQEIQRAEGGTMDEAYVRLQHRVSQMEADLAELKRVELQGIGVVYTDQEGNYRFSPTGDLNFLTESFGLSPVVLHAPMEVEVPVEEVEEDTRPVVHLKPLEPAPEQEETLVVAAAAPKQKSRKRRWVAAAIVLPLLAAGAYTMRDHIPVNGQVFGISPSSPAVVKSDFGPRFAEEDIRFNYPVEDNRIAAIAASNPGLSSIYFDFVANEMSPSGVHVNLSEAQVADAVSTATHIPTTAANVASSKSGSLKLFFVVGGAFSRKSNAEGMAKKLQDKGFDAYVFGKHRGLHMVCYGSYTNEASARMALKEVKGGENPQAWLKRH